MHALKENEVTLITNDAGDMPHGLRRYGLYFRDTRYLSVLSFAINGKRPVLLAASSAPNYLCEIQMTNPALDLEDETVVPAQTIGVHRSRVLKDGIHERLGFYNHNLFSVPLEVSVTLGGDFADMFEVRGLERAKRGNLSPPAIGPDRVALVYTGLDS